MNETPEGLRLDELASLGLPADEIRVHQQRIRRALADKQPLTIPILDTCRLDNGGILPADWLSDAPGGDTADGFVGFVPAAGAASRYFKPLTPLIEALKVDDARAIDRAIEGLRSEGANQWALPSSVMALVRGDKHYGDLDETQRSILGSDVQKPKALLPCTQDGTTFLEMKAREHRQLEGILGQVFITPPDHAVEFSDALSSSGVETSIPTVMIEQGLGLSTLRFDENALPVREDDDKPSVVPAGHGTLVKLFPEVRRRFPNAHSLLIRNVDNVMGTSHAVEAATERFMKRHVMILEPMRRIRKALAARDLTQATAAARAMLAWPGLPKASDDALRYLEEKTKEDARLSALWEVELRLFQMNPDLIENVWGGKAPLDILEQLYARPVNLLGQVPNTGKDVGGTPVFAKTRRGVQKVCLELPHASADDQRDFMANPSKATHFNPVFVAAELIESPAVYEPRDSELWIMAAKPYRGGQAYYHETVLYELLGNNLLANALFTEIPRILFNPHKTLSDGAGKTSAHWLRDG